VWRHGDFFRINARGGCFVLGRSDATLNRHGVRIGTAEVYAVLASINEIDDALIVNLDLPDGGFFMPLFVKLADNGASPGGDPRTPGASPGGGARTPAALDDALRARIRDRLRAEYTPRHVPDKIIQVPDIPVTLTGKKMEVPVRRILRGMPAEQAANRNAMANPQALDFFVDYAAAQQDYPTG
jgi:acetoacetyl-CoA synthetase